jgi:hypothetical protein
LEAYDPKLSRPRSTVNIDMEDIVILGIESHVIVREGLG